MNKRGWRENGIKGGGNMVAAPAAKPSNVKTPLRSDGGENES